MKENATEKMLRKEVAARGGFCVKLDPTGVVGIPDRLVILPGAILFVEVKRAKGGRIAELQHWWAGQLAARGAVHRFVVGNADVEKLMAEYDEARRALA